MLFMPFTTVSFKKPAFLEMMPTPIRMKRMMIWCPTVSIVLNKCDHDL